MHRQTRTNFVREVIIIEEAVSTQSCYDKRGQQRQQLCMRGSAHNSRSKPILAGVMLRNVFCYVSFAWFGGACTTLLIKGTIDGINDF